MNMTLGMQQARPALLAALLAAAPQAQAQQLATRFACSAEHSQDGIFALHADRGEIRIDGEHILAFDWESSLFRRTHGFDCSIDTDDGTSAEVRQDADGPSWRISLKDAVAARERRGYDFSHGLNCTIRLEQRGNTLLVRPSCPALCGSRANFSELAIDLKSGACSYPD